MTDSSGKYNSLAFSATDTVAGVGSQSTGSASLEGVTPTLTYYSGTSATGTALSGAPTMAGTYTVLASFAGSTDYASGTMSNTFTISKATPTLSVPNGTASAVTVDVAGVGSQSAAASSLEGVTPTATYYSGATRLSGVPTAPGTYSAAVSFTGSTDYTSTIATIPFTLTKATPTVLVSDPSGSYTGSPFVATVLLTVAGSQSSPTSSLEGITPTLQYYTGTSASGGNWTTVAPKTLGTYTVLATYQGSTEYSSASASTTFTITPAGPAKVAPTLVVTGTNGTYNSSAFAATDTVAGVGSQSTAAASLEGVTPTLTYYLGASAQSGAPSAAGVYTVVESFAGSTDYASASTNTVFTISQATPRVTVSDPGGTANGTTTFPATATVAGVGSQSAAAASLEGVTPTLQYYLGTNATGNNWTTAAPNTPGTYTVLATFPGSTDYLAASGIPSTFTVYADPFITATSGSGQTGAVYTPFAQAFTTNVVDTHGNPVSGAAVTFTAPTSGAGGTFAGGLTSVVVATNAAGTATAPAFTANGTTGGYSVIASTPGAAVPATFTLTNQQVVSEADPVNPGQTALFIGGAPGNDQIHVQLNGSNLEVIITDPTVNVDQLVPIPTDGFSRLVIHGGPDQNQIQVDNLVTTPTWIYADGDVSNNVQTGSGPSIVIGGSGANSITGGSGRDVLMAGAGKSTIQAGSGDALIIGGTTDYDANDLALQAILNEWASPDTLSTRMTKLANGSITAGSLSVALNSSTVHSNEQQNTLAGSAPSNNDLFFANLASEPDTIVDPDLTDQIL